MEEHIKRITHINHSNKFVNYKERDISILAMKDSQGNLKTKKQDVLHIWKAHFEKHLNTQFNHEKNALQNLTH